MRDRLKIVMARLVRSLIVYLPPRRRGMRLLSLVERVSLLPTGHLTARHASGFLVDCDLSDNVQKSMFYRGTWEPEASGLIVSELPEGGYFVDIGANAG